MSLSTRSIIAIAVTIPVAVTVLVFILLWRLRKSQQDQISITSEEENSGSELSSTPPYTHHFIRVIVRNPTEWLQRRGFEDSNHIIYQDDENHVIYHLYLDGHLMCRDKNNKLEFGLHPNYPTVLVANHGKEEIVQLTGFLVQSGMLHRHGAIDMLRRSGLPVRVIPEDLPFYKGWEACTILTPWKKFGEEGGNYLIV